jgi:predicted nucleotidyltransferase
MYCVSPLLDVLIGDLVAEFADADTIGMLLAGSYARGDATPYSDIDLFRFTSVLPEADADRYTLVYRENHLVSLSTTTVDAKRAELGRPETAIWAVPGLRQARILLDRDGALPSLLQEAQGFRWEPLQSEADAYASYNAMGLAEEVHKVLGALERADESAALNATWALVAGLARAVIVQCGVLIRTENAYFQQAQEAAGLTSAWSRAFRVAAGFEALPAGVSPVLARTSVALRLYDETATLLSSALQPQHLAVIRGALARIRASGLMREGEWGI